MDMTRNIVHENTILRAGAYIASKQGIEQPIEVGNYLVSQGSDDLVSGGFWVWDVDSDIEFYSPKFREALGFEGEHDFPNVAQSWQNQIEPESLIVAMTNATKVMKTAASMTDMDAIVCPEPYRQMVKYRTKQGGIVELFCSGSLLMNNGKPTLFVGTHVIKSQS